MRNTAKHIVLISCVKKKKATKDKAKNLYISSLFQKYWKYSQSFHSDKIFILSAKYGLLDPEQIIEPYDESLNNISSRNRKAWADKVLSQMRTAGLNLEKDRFTILAGKNYRQYLIGEQKIKYAETPLADIGGIGKILSYLNTHIQKEK